MTNIMYGGKGREFSGRNDSTQIEVDLSWNSVFICVFFSVSEKEHSVSTNFTVKTEDIAFFESEEECSVLTNFTMKTQDRATFEWENGKVVTAYLLKEKDECIYR